MAKASNEPENGPTMDALVANAGRRSGLPPVHLWDPPFCGDIDMRIARDGTWFYAGTPIGRPSLVRLFASILRKDADRFVLVTPVEKVGIAVEDAPFLAVEMAVEVISPARLRLRTNVDDWVAVDEDHPLRFEPGASGALKPYVRVRGDLWALVTRALFYDLMAIGEEREVDGLLAFGIASGGFFFPMAPIETIADAAEGCPLA